MPRKIILLLQCRNDLVFELPAPPSHVLYRVRCLIWWPDFVLFSFFPCIILHILQIPSTTLSPSHEARYVLIIYCLFKIAFLVEVSFLLKVCVCVHKHVYIQAPYHTVVDVRGQTCGTWFLSCTVWVLGTHSGHQAWGQVPFPAEPSGQVDN